MQTALAQRAQITASLQEKPSSKQKTLSKNEINTLKATVELKRQNYLKNINTKIKTFKVNLRNFFINPYSSTSNKSIREVFYNPLVQSNNPLKNILGEKLFNTYKNNPNIEITNLPNYQRIAIGEHKKLNKYESNIAAKAAYTRLLQDN